MEIPSRPGLVALLLILAALNLPDAQATAAMTGTAGAVGTPTIGDRLTRLTATLREREAQVDVTDPPPELVAIGWGDGSRGRGWVNSRVGGWGDGRGPSFANFNPWRNGWADGGGFYNYRPGGGWLNGGGSFVNRY